MLYLERNVVTESIRVRAACLARLKHVVLVWFCGSVEKPLAHIVRCIMATVHQRNNATENKVCPVSNCCSSLILKQINADEAVYVCSNPECFYPVGEEVEIVSRKVPELSLKEELQDELSSSRQIPEKEGTWLLNCGHG